MSKRGRGGDQLTGGSGDVNPQVLSSFVVQTANDTTTQLTINLPIPRLPVTKGRALVMEALWVEWFMTNTPTAAASNQVLGILSTNPTIFGSATAALQDSKVISQFFRSITAITGAGFFQAIASLEDRMTDDAGHGILIATDKLYLTCYSAASGSSNEVVMKMGYRFKDVALSEYVGIVQSQQ